MSEDKVELFQRAIKALIDDDPEMALALSDSQGSFEPLRSATEGAFRGHDGMRTFYEDTRASFEVFVPEYDDVRTLDDARVLALGRIRLRGRGSGAEVVVSSACLVTSATDSCRI